MLAQDITRSGSPIPPPPPDYQLAGVAQESKPVELAKTDTHGLTTSKEILSEQAFSSNQLDNLTTFLQSAAALFNRDLRFEVEPNSKQVQIKVVDPQTEKVIREIPASEILKFQVRFRDLVGMLLDEVI